MRGDSSAWWRAWRSLVGLKESGDEVCCGAPVSVTKKMTQVDLYEDRFCGEIGCVADSTVGFDEERAVGFVDEGGGDVHGAEMAPPWASPGAPEWRSSNCRSA